VAIHVHPVVPRQPGAVGQEIAQACLLGRDGIAQPKLRQYRSHGHVPIEPALVHQQCKSRCGEDFVTEQMAVGAAAQPNCRAWRIARKTQAVS